MVSAPIVCAGLGLGIIYWFWIAGRGYLAMSWTSAFIFTGLIAVASFYLCRKGGQKAMFDAVFGRATVSYRYRNTPGRHHSKTVTVYPKLARMNETNIQQGSRGRAGAAITIPIYVNETEVEKLDGSVQVVKDEHTILYHELHNIPAEPRNDSWLPRGFTLRIAQTIYGRLKGVTIHGEIESGAKHQAARILMEVVGWLPAIIVWTLIVVSLFSGFSVAETIGNYTQGLPDQLKGVVNDPH